MADQYRIRLDSGDILVLTLEVEASEATETAPIDPAGVGAALLDALGLGRPVVKQATMRADRKQVSKATPEQQKANDESADTWLRRTTEQSFGQKISRKFRAEGDTDD